MRFLSILFIFFGFLNLSQAIELKLIKDVKAQFGPSTFIVANEGEYIVQDSRTENYSYMARSWFVFDAKTGEIVFELPHVNESLLAVQVAPKISKIMFVGSRASTYVGNLSVYDLKTGKKVYGYPQYGVSSAVLDEERNTLLVLMNTFEQASLVDLTTGKSQDFKYDSYSQITYKNGHLLSAEVNLENDVLTVTDLLKNKKLYSSKWEISYKVRAELFNDKWLLILYPDSAGLLAIIDISNNKVVWIEKNNSFVHFSKSNLNLLTITNSVTTSPKDGVTNVKTFDFVKGGFIQEFKFDIIAVKIVKLADKLFRYLSYSEIGTVSEDKELSASVESPCGGIAWLSNDGKRVFCMTNENATWWEIQ